jgi:hypothetical protein
MGVGAGAGSEAGIGKEVDGCAGKADAKGSLIGAGAKASVFLGADGSGVPSTRAPQALQ